MIIKKNHLSNKIANKIIKKIFFYILLLIGVSALAAEISPSDALKAKLLAFNTLSAEFEQVITDEEGELLEKSAGNLMLARPGKFRWEINTPVKQFIIAKNQTAWIIDQDLNQVIIKSLPKNFAEAPALLLMHPEAYLTQAFDIASPAENHFVLTPKNSEEASFTQIDLHFEAEKLTQMKLQHALGQTTVIRFSDVDLAPSLPSDAFIFKPLKNMDIIDERSSKGVAE